MTRSVEIPEAAVEAACRVSYARWDESTAEVAKDAGRKSMRAALEAALPYLAPAEPEDTRTDEERGFVETALAAADSGSAGHWPTVAGYLADEVRRLRAAPAVPQPVDREALLYVLTKWGVGGWKYEDAERRVYRERVATSLLAMLAGEQEQVEP